MPPSSLHASDVVTNTKIDFLPALTLHKSGDAATKFNAESLLFRKKRILDTDDNSGKSVWKFVNVRGRIRSSSHSDLQVMKDETMAPDFTLRNIDLYPTKSAYLAGQSPLEKLPLEILSELSLAIEQRVKLSAHKTFTWCLPNSVDQLIIDSIFEDLILDIPPNGAALRNIDLVSLLLTSKTVHFVTLPTIYKNITIPHSTIFGKFLMQITSHPSLGELVRRMDFSHFNPTADGSTVRERASRQNLTQETLMKALKLTPHLQEFLTQEYVDTEIDNKVLFMLLAELHGLVSLDFCGCSSLRFRDAFLNVVCYQPKPLPSQLSITRLSLHECIILPFDVFEILLPRLTNLTHLDVAHTRIKSHALHLIPETARLTHLNLARCSNLDGADVVKFLTKHPACKSIIYLNLFVEAKSSELFDIQQLERLVPSLPSTLKSLNIKGSKMSTKIVKLLLPFTKHLEELGLGRNLDVHEIMEFFATSEVATCNLRYIDISDISARGTTVADLTNSQLLRPWSIPLEVIELEDSVATAFHGKP